MHDHEMIRGALRRLVRVTDLLRQSRILLVAAGVGTVFWATLLFRPAFLAPIATWSENRFAAMQANTLSGSGDDERSGDGVARVAEVAVDLLAPEPAKHLSLRNLTAEQQTIAHFLSKRYRVAIDRSQEFVDLAYKTAKDMKMDPWLLLAVMSVESSLNPQARSSQGAQGLMQVLTRVHAEKFAPFGGVSAAFDPLVNIRVGARILREYIERDGSIEGALKSYVGAAFHANDQGYGGKVLTERDRLAAVAAGRPFAERQVEARTESRSDSKADGKADNKADSREQRKVSPVIATTFAPGGLESGAAKSSDAAIKAQDAAAVKAPESAPARLAEESSDPIEKLIERHREQNREHRYRDERHGDERLRDSDAHSSHPQHAPLPAQSSRSPAAASVEQTASVAN